MIRVHGLAPCRTCALPVAAPVDIFSRELFHMSRCPHCGQSNPHPQEVAEMKHVRRTAMLGLLILAAIVTLVQATPPEILAP